MIHLLPVTFWITGLWCTSATLSCLSLSSFYFPSLALIFTASFYVYMPGRLKEAKHLLPLPPRVRELFTQPHSFLWHHTGDSGDSPPGWGRPSSSWVSPVESVDWSKTKRWILTLIPLLTTRGLPSPKWRFAGGRPSKVDPRFFYCYFPPSQARELCLLTFLCCFARLFSVEVQVYTCLYNTLTLKILSREAPEVNLLVLRFLSLWLCLCAVSYMCSSL